MKYNLILEKFKVFGTYHFYLAVVTHLSMVMSFYLVLSLAFEKTLPVTMCRNENSLEFIKCEITDYCSHKLITKIDEENSVTNWASRFEIYCERSYIFDYITSSIFACSILSSLLMSLIADRVGRKICFISEVTGNLISYILLYYTNSLYFIFVGVILNEMSSHLYNISMIYIYEYFPLDIYVYLIVLQNIMYGVVGLSLSIYIQFYKETKFLLIIMASFSLVCLIYGVLYLTESPEWLLDMHSHNRENKKYLKQLNDNYILIQNFNNVGNRCEIEKLYYLIDNIIDLVPVKDESTDDEKNIKATESSNKFILYKRLILATYLWIVNQILFYSTLTNLATFEQKIEHSFTIFFTSQVVANLLVAYVTNKIGMKNTLIFTSSVATLFIMGLFIMENQSYYVKVLLFFLFNCMRTFNGETVYIFIPSIFEAKIRSTATSYTKIPAKLLLVLTPFVIGKNIYVLYTIFAILTSSTPLMLWLLF